MKYASPGAEGKLSTFSVHFGFRESTGVLPKAGVAGSQDLQSSIASSTLLKQTSNLPKVGASRLAKSKPEATIVEH